MPGSSAKTKSILVLSGIFVFSGWQLPKCLALENDGVTILGNLNAGAMHADALRPRMLEELVTDSNTRHQPAVWIEGTRKLHTFSNVRIICSSGDAQFDFDCLHAFCGSDTGNVDGGQYSTGFDCCVSDNSGARREREDFRRTNQLLNKPDVLLYYKIPLGITSRYRTLFTTSELREASNIGTIENKSREQLSPQSVSKLTDLYTVVWPKFYATHANPSKAEVREFAEAVCTNQLLDISYFSKL